MFPDYKDDDRFWCKPMAQPAVPGSLPNEQAVVAAVGGKD
jgi:hypothetical protein